MTSGNTEWGEFIAALPASIEQELVGSDFIFRAFQNARTAGWATTLLAADAAHRYQRTGNIGAIVAALRNQAENPPIQRKAGGTGMPRHVASPVQHLPPEYAHARIQILKQALAGELADPEADMRALIQVQNEQMARGEAPGGTWGGFTGAEFDGHPF